MICYISWKALSFTEWNERFSRVKRANLLQSYSYAHAMCKLNNQTARWGMIEIDGVEAGIVQILEAGLLKNAIHAIILDRGPLWFDGFGNENHIKSFFTTFNQQFPARFGRKRRIIPETDLDLTSLGLKKSNKGYETLSIDLRKDLETLRANLKKNWRGALQKAEKSHITIEWDASGEHFPWLIQNYAVDRETKGYDGPSVKLIRALATTMLPRGEMLIGRAILNGQPIAGIMIICHGRGATYQLGFSNTAGRQHNAHHILLWHAIERLKNNGITDFDLGGTNDETAKGIKKFKQGMGGKAIQLSGLYT